MMWSSKVKSQPNIKHQSLAKSVGVLIAARRKSLGLTQGELAERVGIEQESMSRIETGSITPSLNRLFSLADALDCTVESLLSPASRRKPDQSLLLEKLLGELDEAERAFVVRMVSDFSKFVRSHRNMES
jgi:transcriptional regulator with XRE-family HTH domain